MSMNWTLIISIALNIVSILVYFSVPEFLQQLFIKNIEHKYDVKLNRINRHNEVLPELFYKVSGAVSYYDINYTGQTYHERDLIAYAELKNFITQNQFFIPKDIRDISREIEDEILEFMSFKNKTATTAGGEEVENMALKQRKSKEKLNRLIDELEEKIYRVIEN